MHADQSTGTHTPMHTRVVVADAEAHCKHSQRQARLAYIHLLVCRVSSGYVFKSIGICDRSRIHKRLIRTCAHGRMKERNIRVRRNMAQAIAACVYRFFSRSPPASEEAN